MGILDSILNIDAIVALVFIFEVYVDVSRRSFGLMEALLREWRKCWQENGVVRFDRTIFILSKDVVAYATRAYRQNDFIRFKVSVI
ncbi:hypothetical protein [Streptococcus ruminantium]|uniref:hypothetical protein n=1 Tax=Streptococcus ruminantium TaxID=1917441 RepID=UPI0013EF1A19|nr:hypothetical protein [Streptococcus ruminantium]